ncbi:hypothetical protein AZI86_04510 [Bdellovibrio bacteriovorus]|uniref:FxsA protein n=1 Tax=Bdellovibrio bacteriovorus TaxID=959 RepID=A0A150WP91_BDEBC|nr:FxsA family protein [Bdellovibrio bacteriovorus]KYG66323.1 hypothetical protein AZI86_04510 [Bdellovibrio bacteriovorus]
MVMIPFPMVIAEFLIFFFAVKQWGFLNTLGLYLLPCLLGFVIVSVVGRLAMYNLQNSMRGGQLPGNQLLSSGAVFISGILFLVPSFFARVLAVILFLPGLRHLAIWKFKSFLAKKMAQGSGGFQFGGPFGFGGGTGGFRTYQYRTRNHGFDEPSAGEREVREANVLDVTPIKVTHEEKKNETPE